MLFFIADLFVFFRPFPAEAIEKMLQEKRISNKINYEVLKNLNLGVGPSAPASKSTAAAAAASASPSTAVEETKPARFRFQTVPLGFTGFYWVLLGFTGFYWVLLGFTESG